MAISYTDYKKKYNENITESQNKYNELRKQQVQNSTTNKTTSTISTTNKLKQEKNNRVQELLKQRQQEISLPTYTETKTSPFNTNFKTDNNKNNMNTVNQQLSKLKNASQNEELKKLVKENTKTSLGETIGKTIGTGSALLTRGGLGALEKFHEFSLNASSNINTFLAEKLGIYTKEQAEKERKSAQELIKRSLKNEAMKKIGWNEDLWQEMEKGSLIKRDNIGGKVIEGIGEMLPTLAVGSSVGTTGNLTKVQRLITSIPTSLTMGVGAYGGSLEQAYNEGATTNQANKYALGSALVETATEWLTGGVPGVNDVGILDSLEDKTLSKVSNSLAKFLIKNSYNVIGEGTEEALSEIINPILKNATYSQGEKVDWNAVIESAIVGGITGGILDMPGNISNYRTDVNVNKLKQQQISNQATQNFIEQNNIKPTQINTNKISLPKIDTNQEINVQQNLEKLSTKNNINLPKTTNVDSDIFSKQVDEVVNGTFNKDNHMTVLEHTPEVLQKLGVKDLPITLTTSKLDRIMNESGKQKGEYHGLKETVKKLPEAIQNPLDIVKSYDNSYVLTTDLSDNQDRSVIVSLKIDGKGYIENIEIDTNVMTSAYGRNNYDNWMKKHQEEGNIVYDIDRGYIDTKKLGAIPGLQLPNNNSKFINESDTTDRVQFPMRGSSSSTTTSDIPKNTSPISYDNNTTNLTKSQIAPLPSQYSMQQNVENDTKIPSSKERKEKISMPSVRQNSEVLKVQSEKIANQINKTGDIKLKERSWVETSTESQILKDKVLISDLDTGKINYVVQSNKKSLDKANNYLNTYGYDETLKHVNELLKNEQLPSASDVALIQRMIQEASKKGDVETVQNLIMDTAILGTDLGQATQALSIIQRLTPEGQLKLYTKIVQRAKARGEKSFQSVEITPEMVQNILEAYKADGTYDQNDLNARVEQFKQDIANQMKTTTTEKINTWRYLAMLGNPKTHIRNLVSNVAMKYTLKAKNAVARTLETVIPLETKTKTWKKASDVVQKFADKTTTEMKNIITGEAKYSDKGSIEAKKQIFKNKTLEKISDFNSNALSAEDWFFSKSAFKNTFQEYLTANGIITEADIQKNPEIIEKAKQYAVEQAEIATFRQYSKLASQISQLERKNKFARFAIEATVPFKKTPINVAKAGFKYSPLGLIKNVSYDVYQLKIGNINGSQFIDNLSQGLTGTTLTLIGYALAKSGILSGAGGDDKENKYDSNLGKQSYALNIGGSSYSISWLSPVAIPLLVGANAYEKLEEQEDWNPDVIADTLAQTLDPLSEMSFVSSLTDVLTSYNSGSSTMIKDIGETATQSYILQFFPTLFSQFASVLDDKKRSTKVSNNSSFKFGEETVRKIMYKIPGLRNKLEVATDIWGNEKEQSSNIIERAVESFIAPYSKTKDISTTLDAEIKRVYNETGENGVIPNIPYAYVKYKNETYRMSANEYTKYKKTYGQKANAYLTELIKTTSYNLATDEVKAKMMSNVYDFARAEANEEYFKNIDVEYTNDTLKELTKLKKIGIDNKALANYVSDKTQISSIRGDTNYDTTEKKEKVAKIFVSSSLNDKQLSYLYSKYYSTEEKVNAINSVNIPIKEFIKYDLTDFASDYNVRTGQTISGSKQKKVINYINSLKLSVAQKALLIKMEYNSFDGYDNQIINYVRSSGADYLNKAYLLKKSGFDNYDKDIINYVQRHYNTIKEKKEILKKLGFTVRNGRVY